MADQPVKKATPASATRKKTVVKKDTPVTKKVVAQPAPEATAVQDAATPVKDLSELQIELERLDEQRAHIERMIINKRRTTLRDFCNEIGRMVKERGYDIDEVLDVLNKRRARAKGVAPGGSRLKLTRFVDNEDPSLVYVRGVTPEWMKRKMREKGFDPDSGEDRRRFRKEHMHAEEAEGAGEAPPA